MKIGEKPAEEVRTYGPSDKVIEILRTEFGSRLVTGEAVRTQHSSTLTWLHSEPPDAVVFPTNTEEVSRIVAVCAEHTMPIIAFGAGTSLEGQVNAPHGGICVDLSNLNKILEVNAEDLDCVVEPGVTREQLNEYLRATGLFFPIDPGANATIGGMTATRASGTNAVRYGTMKDCVVSLKVVLPDGSIVKTASRARKSSAGYDLTRLFVGSEGTLGIITEITLRLFGIPEAISAGTCSFPSLGAACNATILAMQSGIPMARIEFLDTLQVQSCNAHSQLGLPETPLLLLEFHGTSAGVEEQATQFGEIAADLGGGPLSWATQPEDRTRLWRARHELYFANKALRPGADIVPSDVCVPISRLAECLEETCEDARESNLVAPVVGHVGDGNFHATLLVDKSDADEMRRAEDFLERLSLRAIRMGGTCTGEHGLGQGKMKYLVPELGEPAANLMRRIRDAVDPQSIMNPGKVVSAQ